MNYSELYHEVFWLPAIIFRISGLSKTLLDHRRALILQNWSLSLRIPTTPFFLVATPYRVLASFSLPGQ